MGQLQNLSYFKAYMQHHFNHFSIDRKYICMKVHCNSIVNKINVIIMTNDLVAQDLKPHETVPN